MYWIIGKILGLIVVLYLVYTVERMCIADKIPFVGYMKDSCSNGLINEIKDDFEKEGILALLGDVLVLVFGLIIALMLIDLIIIGTWPVAIPTIIITMIISRKLLNKQNKEIK